MLPAEIFSFERLISYIVTTQYIFATVKTTPAALLNRHQKICKESVTKVVFFRKKCYTLNHQTDV